MASTFLTLQRSMGPYHSEELLGKALGNRRKDVILVTKVGFGYSKEGKILGRNSKYDNIIKCTEGCLRRLETDVIDLMLIHWPDYETPLDEPMLALEQLKKDGKIRYGGVSNFNTEIMDYCRQYSDVAVNQVGYHLFDQRMNKVILPYCLENNIGFMAYGTLGFGLLTGAFIPETTLDPLFNSRYGETDGYDQANQWNSFRCSSSCGGSTRGG